MTKAIENSQEKGEKMDEIVGLAVRVTNKDLEAFLAENKDMVEEEVSSDIEAKEENATAASAQTTVKE